MGEGRTGCHWDLPCTQLFARLALQCAPVICCGVSTFGGEFEGLSNQELVSTVKVILCVMLGQGAQTLEPDCLDLKPDSTTY